MTLSDTLNLRNSLAARRSSGRGVYRLLFATSAAMLLAAGSAGWAAELISRSAPMARIVDLGGDVAEISGPQAKIEHGVIGHWHSVDTKAQWRISIAEPCTVDVEVLAAVEEPFAGGKFVVQIGDQQLRGETSPTGGWFEFAAIRLGKVKLTPGDVVVSLQPAVLPEGVFGNVQAVRLSGAVLSEVKPAPASDVSGPVHVYTTACYDGTRLMQRNSLKFRPARTPVDGTMIVLDPHVRFQKIEGFGGAFTEATAHVFAQLTPEKQQEFLRAYFDAEEGHGYRLGRAHINSCDFCVESYALDDVPGDVDLKHFSIDHDRREIIPLIHAAQEVAGNEPLKILASPWSPPAWMKTNGQMTEGGKLKPEYRDAWANYYCRFIKEYRNEDINVWAVSVQNEPMATQTWESCLYSHEEERDFVRDHLGPALRKNGCADTKLLVWDHNRDLLLHRAKTVFDDPRAAEYVWGAAFHWYVTDDFDHVQAVHDLFPDKQLLFTEGCLEHGAHLGDWSGGERYARSVINDLNHWAVGWIDWNLMLDVEGGPNHVGNFCSAPVIGDAQRNELTYNSSYYYLGHFSRFIRPGSTRIRCIATGDDLLATSFVTPDDQVVVVILNEQNRAVPYALQIGDAQVDGSCPDRGIMTLVFDLAKARP